MSNTEKIEKIVKETKIKTNPAVDRAVLDGLLAQLDAARKPQASTPPIWRTVMKNPLKLSAAAAILIVAGLFISQFAFVTPSFADVIRPIFEARSFAFDMVVGNGGPVMHDVVADNRIRRTLSNMPDAVMIIDLDSAKMLNLDAAKKTAGLIDITGPLVDDTRNFIAFVRETITRLRNQADARPQQQKRTIDGRRNIGYTLGNDREQVTVWADARTAAPIEIELRLGQNGYALRNFEFDISVSEDEMSLQPPAGYTLQEATLDFANVTEEVFIESLRVLAQYLNDGVFPDALNTQTYITQVPLIEQKIGPLSISDTEKEQLAACFIHGMFFLQKYELKHEGPWHYAGGGVQLNAPDTPVFWYQPQGQANYRVIYADLHVEELPPDKIPSE